MIVISVTNYSHFHIIWTYEGCDARNRERRNGLPGAAVKPAHYNNGALFNTPVTFLRSQQLEKDETKGHTVGNPLSKWYFIALYSDFILLPDSCVIDQVLVHINL